MPESRMLPALADVISLLEGTIEELPPVETRDRVDVVFLSAFGRVYRCLRNIHRLASLSEADDVDVLTRSLVGTVLRSLYLVQPDDPGERDRRLAQLNLKWRADNVRVFEEMIELGFPDVTDDDVEAQRRLADAHEWAGRLPSDKEIATSLKLGAFYSRVYRPTSDATHFGVTTMMAGFLEEPTSITGEGAVVSLQRSGAPERIEETVGLAALVFGVFLALSEPVVHHGLADRVAEIIRAVHEAS